tara:strand:- start:240 stop:632 length:393 start_codon:yes stop_codon:yes gene_type:complete
MTNKDARERALDAWDNLVDFFTIGDMGNWYETHCIKQYTKEKVYETPTLTNKELDVFRRNLNTIKPTALTRPDNEVIREVVSLSVKTIDHLLHELWDECHSHMSEKQFNEYFEDEYKALEKLKELEGRDE